MQDSTYQKLEHSSPEFQRTVVVNWCIGNTCNYACSYCPESLHNASKPWYDFETVKAFCERTIRHYTGKQVYFEFTGGEVTLWAQLPQLCRFLKGQGARVGIISNGSRSLEFWQKFVCEIDHVCLSFHSESANEEHFVKVVEFMSERVRTHVNIMMAPHNFNRCCEVSRRVVKIPNISLALQPLVVDFGTELFPYTDRQREVMDQQFQLLGKHIVRNKIFDTFRGAMVMVGTGGKREVRSAHRFISRGENSWLGWKCHIGIEQIVVTMDGEVFRGWCLVGGRIGNITDPVLSLPTEPVTCDKTSCHCNFDIMATKERIQPEPTENYGHPAS